jgi:heptosyltransferase-2
MKEIRYRFGPDVSIGKIKKIKLIDRLLNSFFKGPSTSLVVSPITEITIVQMAHIGDLILMLPALKKLKILTNYKINLVVSSQNFLIANKLKYIDSVTVADAPYFSRGKKVSYLNFISQLRRIKSDLIFDVRGDLRNIFFIKLFVKKKYFAGYNVGGGEALLDISLPYRHGEHITGLLEPLFDYLTVPDIDISYCWHQEDIPYDEIKHLDFPSNFLVVHLGTGALARKWPVEYFITTIESLANITPVYVLGTHHDLTEEQLQTIIKIPNVVNCIGKFSILQSIYILKRCSLFLGLDSGFSHIAAMLKKKVFVVFSGTVNKNVWKPYSFDKNQVVLINKSVACDLVTGCGKLVCADNICMKQVYPDRVISVLESYINNSDDYYSYKATQSS